MKLRLGCALVVLLCLGAAGDASALTLRPCGHHGFRCGRLRLPLDYGDPAGPNVSIAVTRLRARDPSRRIGTLFVNYGGPGGNAVATTQRVARSLFAAYRNRFDIVAFDPRGTGASRPTLDCGVDEESLGPYRLPFLPPEAFDQNRDVGIAQTYADRCAARNALIGAHVSTANVARDMDAVRAALGVRKVTYLGFSYGTLLGATYAALFGSHVRAIVLDGPVDPDQYLNHPIATLTAQSAGYERALGRYFDACSRAHCHWLRRRAPFAAYDRLIRRAAAHPLRIRHRSVARGDRRPVTGDLINWAVSDELYAKQLWPEMTVALNQAARGDGSLIRAISDESYGRRKNGGYTATLDRYFLIGASEQQYPRDLQPYLDAGAASVTASPHFFFNSGYSLLPYALYPLRDEDAFLGPFTLPATAPRALVVGTTFDPATPFAGARAMVADLGRARLLTMRGDGHTAYHQGSRCVDRAVDRYLVAGRLPGAGLSCRQHVPFPPRARAQVTSRSLPVSTS